MLPGLSFYPHPVQPYGFLAVKSAAIWETTTHNQDWLLDWCKTVSVSIWTTGSVCWPSGNRLSLPNYRSKTTLCCGFKFANNFHNSSKIYMAKFPIAVVTLVWTFVPVCFLLLQEGQLPKQRGKKAFISFFILQFILKGSQDRDSGKGNIGWNWRRGLGGMMSACLFSMSYSTCFLILSMDGTTRIGPGPTTPIIN